MNICIPWLIAMLVLIVLPGRVAAQTPLHFDGGTTIGIGNGPLCLADLDNDGDMDILASEAHIFSSHTISWWYEQINPVRYVRHQFPFESLTGCRFVDLNGTGERVLVATSGWVGTAIFEADPTSHTAFIEHLLNSNWAWNLRIGDLDGDGRLDIVVSDTDGTAYYHRTTAQGYQFDRTVIAPESIPANFGAFDERTDFNLDGLLDAVVAESAPYPGLLGIKPGDSATTTTYGTLQKIGDLSFYPPPFFFPGLNYYFEYNGQAAGDLDGDGDPDVIMGSESVMDTGFTGQLLLYYDNLAIHRDLEVFAPIAGDRFRAGDAIDVDWRSFLETAGPAIDLELWQGARYVANLGHAENARGRASTRVVLPPHEGGQGFTIEGVSLRDTGIHAASGAFAIDAVDASRLWTHYR